jgi:predicted TPR repeat methyltransferase
LRAGWHDPLKCAELSQDMITENKEQVKIIDFGCGTGLVG